ncbi:serine/threonine-protein kinase [Kineosporia succinea]|uniref:non-specific serine/threonine protein kinase n=1 Tax=Kineosporia succinea TaxID=84632 RepID=A0ABT9PAB1_9ACTN|nr:serine/threonine-protein kinase [Kineosporia succinea]MDP9829626.1 putative Ser/Thr protein kinase [Kineosporia succinea]
MPAPFSPLPGDPDQVAGYQIAGRLGSGGQGVVYLGIAPSGERAAVKMLRFHDEDSHAQFAKEVASARRVAPFCTAQLLDYDLDVAAPYVISEFIEGRSLQQFVAERGPLSGPRLQRLAIGTVTALAAIHEAGVVHRDLKPANVMMAPDGPRVIDFGIARDLSTLTTRTGQMAGTPSYMSPEQVNGDRVGPASDLFSWASVIVFAATGRSPFDAGSAVASIIRVANHEPDLTGLPAELVPVLHQCFSKEPGSRPSAQQVLTMLLGRSVRADRPTAVLEAGSQFAAAGGDSASAPAARDEAGDAPTWARRGPVVGPATDPRNQPRPTRKLRVAGMIGVPALLVAGIGIGIALDTGGTSDADPASPAPEPSVSATGSATGSAVGQTAAGTLPSTLAGTWTGTVNQSSSSVDDWQWQIELDLAAGRRTAGTMKSSDLGCTSHVTVIGTTDDTAHLRAPVTPANDPQGVCSPLGLITLEVDNAAGTADLFWQDTEDPTNVGEAKLTRVGG